MYRKEENESQVLTNICYIHVHNIGLHVDKVIIEWYFGEILQKFLCNSYNIGIIMIIDILYTCIARFIAKHHVSLARSG